MNSQNKAIAIVGVGAILPDAMNATEFWNNLIGKRYSITETPDDRWSIADYFDPDPNAPDKTYSKIGGWVRGFNFDWKKFKIPPKVAAAMDPGQQWAVTIAAQALEDYGYPDRALDTDRTGVILGTAMGGELHYITTQRIIFPEYAHALEQAPAYANLPQAVREQILYEFHAAIDLKTPPISEDTMPGELANIVSGRVANVLNLRGPNFITDAACASSLAALDAAWELLTEHEADAVITGGVDRNMGIHSFVKFCKIGALSATGTRPFGKGANGFVMGEGSAAFLCKRLEDAERNGDKIYAVVRGVGGASDGKGKGITAPNPIGQQLATRRAWENAGIDPATAVMVEAHGTSTKVGDVVEVESLAQIFGGAAKNSIALGSVKSNIGHLKAGAGAAGLLKATLALHHKIIPPTLNSETPNPDIPFDRTPFQLANNAREMPKRGDLPRRVGVSAYGFGGTNFHVVMEEHVPGMLTEPKRMFAAVNVASAQVESSKPSTLNLQPSTPTPPRGILAIGAANANELKNKLDEMFVRVQNGYTPPVALPNPRELKQRERIVMDFGNHDELLERLNKARKAIGFDTPQAWKALQAQGVFRGSGEAQGKIAFLFPGQGSQYLNMGRELAAYSPTVAQVFADADRVMKPILGKPLTGYVFVESSDADVLKRADKELQQTAITQPAMLTLDTAIYKLLAEFGFKPDLVMGHSLGEYAALIAAGIMPFADALEASAARGAEMTKVSMGDNGWMAAVMAPYSVVEQTLKEIDGYVVAANINGPNQSVIGGASKAVEQAIAIFQKRGYQAQRLPVSHAFHTKIVAPASAPLRQVLNRLNITSPTLPLVANVTGELYPTGVKEIKDILELQIASPVQWVQGVQTLYAEGVRTFIEVGPKKALKGLVDDILAEKSDVVSLFSNHPKTGEIPTFNQALCGLYAAGYGVAGQQSPVASQQTKDEYPVVANAPATARAEIVQEEVIMGSPNGHNLNELLAQALQQMTNQPTNQPTGGAYDRNETPRGSIVISGTGLGLPGAEKPVMDPDNALRILHGEQFIDLIPERFRKAMVAKRVTRLVKSEDGSGRFETLDSTDEMIKLAGRPGPFNLAEEYGVPEKLIEALDITTQLAMAAGLDAMREAGIPLVQTYKKTTVGSYLPERWMLPEALRDETGVIFASAFPGGDRFVQEFRAFYEYQGRVEQLNALQDLRNYTTDNNTLRELDRRINDMRDTLAREPYEFDRRFIFRILAMGHSQFAEYVGARGPNTHVNAACASTAQGIALAEDWIRSGRCRRVIVIGADDVTDNNLMEWIGAGFLATGAAATDDRVEEAALPFDRRRHGTILGMGACALVVESQDPVRERGMRGIVELLSSETVNSAFHGTRLDVNHISMVMNHLVSAAERRFGLNRYAMAPQTVFMSHETFTPARGGSASAEVIALRETFGDAASDVIVANTKGFTGHPMGVGVEDVIAVKILEYGIVPPVPNYKEVDPDLGKLNLSRGGRYPVQYALHLAAGFGSQISMTLTRRIPGAMDRVDNKGLYSKWLADLSGYDFAETEVVKRVLRVVAQGAPKRVPMPSVWQYGTGPATRALVGDGVVYQQAPARIVVTEVKRETPGVTPIAPKVKAVTPEPAPIVAKPEPVVAQKAETAPVITAPGNGKQAEPAPAQVATDPIVDKVLDIVAAKTGYPRDMLDLDLDMEADLGIDTVKQAETFAALREAFDIPRQDSLKLRDYPTLKRAVDFVKTARPDLAAAAQDKGPATVAAVVPTPPAVIPIQASTDVVTDKVLDIVAAKTGYPRDMLDPELDLEADLGIDTVKQAETFAAIREAFDIPRQDNIKLRDYPTLKSVIGFVRTSKPGLVQVTTDEKPMTKTNASEPLSSVVHPPSSTDTVSDKVMQIVAAKTGYPMEMLDPELDLEADLGIDTVKQAETFAAIREAFDIPRQDNIKLRDYPTLKSVIGFVHTSKPGLVQVTTDEKPMTKANASEPLASAVRPSSDPVADTVMAIVAAKTGYPREMLDLDADLEADLGVDTVKQAETFAAVREAFDIPRQDNLKLRDYPTLKSVIEFVHMMRPELKSSRDDAGVVSSEPSRVPALTSNNPTPSTGSDEVTAKVLEIVAAKTGYPQEMLELDADLEADLGVDTVKQAETFAAVREAFDIPRQDNLKLRDYPTLKSVILFVRTSKPEMQSPVAGHRSPVANQPIPQAPIATIGSLEDADRIPRRVPTPTLRPQLDWCKPTGVTLDENSRVIVMMDRGGVGRSLVSRLEKRGVTTLVMDEALETETLEARVKAWCAEFPAHSKGAIQGVYWLAALDAEPNLEEMDLAAWRELNRVRVKNLYTTMRALYESVSGANTFLISATRLGGLHGYEVNGASAPLGGAVVGFTKAYKRERNDVLVKAVDFEVSRKTAEPAEVLINETLFDPGIVEVGYRDGNRFGITVIETPNVPNDTGIEFNKDTVFVITGAAGGITSAITTDLAVNSGGVFYLLDLVAPPPADDEDVKLFRENKDALKAKLIDQAKAAGEKPTPVMIDKKMSGIERQEAALRAQESVQAAGGTVYFFAGDLRDANAVQHVMDEIRARNGKIDVIVHAAGLEISRSLPDKDPAQFNLVFDVKADGFFNLLHGAKGMPIGATVVFSSVAGRFGNSGQTDYSAANDLLCKVSSSLRNWRPETRGIAIDWTAWGGIGMATRGSIPKIMEMAGIDMLPAESGVPTVRRELTYNDFRGEIVVGQRLGILGAEWDETGGLDTEKVSRWLETQHPKFAQIATVKAAKLYGGIQVETKIDPNAEAYLFDHQMDNVPLLPGVMGTETFAELAQLLAPDLRVDEILNEKFERPFKFHRMQPQTLYLSAWAEPTRDGELVAHTTLRSITQMPRAEMPPQEKVHFTADVLLTRDEMEQPHMEFNAPDAHALDITAEQIYKIYFHGPAYQVLERVRVDGDTAIALMQSPLPADTSHGEGDWIIAPRLVEFCFQTAGLWEMKTNRVMALPMAIGSVTAYRQLRDANEKRLYALVTAIDSGKAFDCTVVDESGAVYVKMFGYRTVQLPGNVTIG